MIPFQPTRFGGFMSYARDGRHQNLVAKATRQGNGALPRPANGSKLVVGTQPGRTEPILAPRKHRHGLARARPDSPALRPLHSLPHSATPTPQDAFAHSTATNSRDRRETGVRYPVEIPRARPFSDRAISLRYILRPGKRPPSLQNTGNGLTPRPSVSAPGYVAAHAALAALRPTLRQITEESA
jgi:hypothetical protein